MKIGGELIKNNAGLASAQTQQPRDQRPMSLCLIMTPNILGNKLYDSRDVAGSKADQVVLQRVGMGSLD